MQVLQAGPHKLLLLELDREFIENIARQAGFEFRFEEESRRVLLDRSGRALPYSVRLQINKELPASFRLPNKAPVTEQTVYSVLFNFMNALLNTGVGVCGGPVVQALAGRTEPQGNRN